MVSLALLAATGCKGKADGAKPKADEAGSQGPSAFAAEVTHVKAGWIGAMAKDKGTFDRLGKTSTGWAKYYKGEIRGAASSFFQAVGKTEKDPAAQAIVKIGLGRALYEIGDLLGRSGRLHLRFLREYFGGRALRRAKDDKPETSERLYHGIALLLSNETDAAATHLDAVIATGPGVYGAQGKAWKGYLTQRAGGDATALWAEAAKAAPEVADLVTYLKARTGTLPEEALEGGTPMRDRLKAGVEVYRGNLEDAEDAAAEADPKAPDQTDKLRALAAEDAAGEADLRYFSPTLLDDLARANLLQAKATLEGVGGCAGYWLGRTLEALGDKTGATAAYAQLAAKPGGKAAAGPDPLACVAFSPFMEADDLTFDAGLRAAALEGKKRPLEATDDRLIRRAWRLRAALPPDADRTLTEAALGPLKDIPDDALPLQGEIEEALEAHGTPGGVALVRKLRLDAWYANAVLRAKAAVASGIGEFPVALALLEASHDNQHSDALSSVNRPGYLLDTGIVNWEIKRRRRALEHVRWLSGRFPELWQNNEFMRRVDAIEAVGLPPDVHKGN